MNPNPKPAHELFPPILFFPGTELHPVTPSTAKEWRNIILNFFDFALAVHGFYLAFGVILPFSKLFAISLFLSCEPLTASFTIRVHLWPQSRLHFPLTDPQPWSFYSCDRKSLLSFDTTLMFRSIAPSRSSAKISICCEASTIEAFENHTPAYQNHGESEAVLGGRD